MKNNNKIELLAPAGNLEKMKTALLFGADAVYAGIPDFSLRVRINDFDLGKIKEATEYCHGLGKKIYITVNIFAHNKHIEKLDSYIKELKDIGVDALIISDPGVMMAVKTVWPEAEIHLSTQANCTNAAAAKFWYKQGVKRVILGREVTLEEIKVIHKEVPKLDLEYFVHGAMCMAYSGRCFLSKEILDRSGNLGDCVQPCRWPHFAKASRGKAYKEAFLIRAEGHEEEFEVVEEEHGSYILNSKDLCLLQYLKDLKEAGVISFKIEGRAKSAYYQAVVCGIYSHVTHNIEHIAQKDLNFLYNELEEKLVHRGYTTGFLLGGKGEQNVDDSHNQCEWEFCGQVYNANAANLRRILGILNTANVIFVKVHNSLRAGDEIEIVRPLYDIIKMKVEKLWDVESGEELNEAHGGQDKFAVMSVSEKVPEGSVLRRSLSR